MSATKTDPPKRLWSSRSPDGPWDYIVIGSGMGGMTTAAILAKLGKRVLVLEQHYTAGGFTHMFKRKGYTWDVGVHAVGEVTEHSMTGRLLTTLTDGELKWASLGPVYDEFYYPDDFRIDFPDSPEQFVENLLEAFPDERFAIGAYMNLVREVVAGMKGYYLARTMSGSVASLADWLLARKAKSYFLRKTEDVIDELTDNPKLKAVLTAQWGYYGSTPPNSSFAIQALVSKHFLYGGYYPVGGAGQIARGLLGAVEKAGGWTRVNASVERILIENGRAVGVRLTDGEEIRAGGVVSAAGIVSTVRRLLPEGYAGDDWAVGIRDLKAAPAHVCLYMGFKGDIRQAGASAANKWFYNVFSSEIPAWDVTPGETMPEAPCLYCSFPSLKDPEHDPGPEVRHTGEVVTFVPWERFAEWQGTKWKKRPEAYNAFKKEMEESLLRQFLAKMPELEPFLDYYELSTPLSTDHFCRPIAGSIYGIEPTPERFENPWLRARAPIKGLYFSGSEVATVGVIGAMMGGVLGAAAAEPVGTMGMLKRASSRKGGEL